MIQDKEHLYVPASPVTLTEFEALYPKVLQLLRHHAASLKIETIKLDLDYLTRRTEIGFKLHRETMT